MPIEVLATKDAERDATPPCCVATSPVTVATPLPPGPPDMPVWRSVMDDLVDEDVTTTTTDDKKLGSAEASTWSHVQYELAWRRARVRIWC